MWPVKPKRAIKAADKARRRAGEHPAFVEYEEFIVNHPNYADMPGARREDGSVRWVVASSSALGKRRREWWRSRLLPGERYLRDAAFRLHPTKQKPCQICGRVMELDYVYPARNRLQRVYALLKERGQLTPELAAYLSDPETMLTHVREVVRGILERGGEQAVAAVAEAYKVPPGIHRNADAIVDYLLELPVRSRRGLLSPGAMSNAPDRLDGFHSYNLCHREEADKGRSRRNLAKYGEDRRAFESWVDGDHKIASWAMKEFTKYGWSADHIGPVSQGFAHRPNGFRPATREFQSTRRDRLRVKDISLLVQAEREGEEVASWHVRALWNALKECAAASDARAADLGRAMRQQVHDALTLLYHLLKLGHEPFLRHLRRDLYKNHLVRVRGEGLRLEPGLDREEVDRELRDVGEYHRAIRVEVDRGQLPLRAENTRNAHRVVRKSIEALRRYAEATAATTGSRRKHPGLSEDRVKFLLTPVLDILNKGGRKVFPWAEEELLWAVEQLALEKAEQLKKRWSCS